MSENNDPLIRSSGYVDNYGLGIRILLMGSPLKLDYGIPLNSPSYLDSSPQFHFSFGGRY